MENFTYLCSVITKNNTPHLATLPIGIIRYIKVPITTLGPSHCRSNDSITLIRSVVHTYHPAISEPNNVPYQNMK